MIIRVCRLSGRPVEADAIAAYDADWKAGYDAAELQVTKGRSLQNGAYLQQEVLEMQGLLNKLETTLKAKHSIEGTAELPASAEDWLALMKCFEAPLMLAPAAGNASELILVIIDRPISD